HEAEYSLYSISKITAILYGAPFGVCQSRSCKLAYVGMLQSRGSKERGRRSRLFLLKIGQHGMLRLWNFAVPNTCGNLWYVSLGLLPALFFLPSSAALKACVSGPRRPGAKKRLVSCLAREQDHGNPPPISRIERKQNIRLLAMPLWF